MFYVVYLGHVFFFKSSIVICYNMNKLTYSLTVKCSSPCWWSD